MYFVDLEISNFRHFLKEILEILEDFLILIFFKIVAFLGISMQNLYCKCYNILYKIKKKFKKAKKFPKKSQIYKKIENYKKIKEKF